MLTGCDIDNISTCRVAVLKFDVKKWKDVKEGTAELLDFEFPKKLRE